MPSTPLVVHLIYRLDVGGLETLLVDCINRMPPDRYRHAIICLTESSPFEKKIVRSDVPIFSLHKASGLSPVTHFDFYKLISRLKPTILHTYNLAAIEYHFAAAIAGVPVLIHAEHGRDAADPNGNNRKHNLLRRLLAPLLSMIVPVSGDLQRWFHQDLHIPAHKLRLVPNGVDTDAFFPLTVFDNPPSPFQFPPEGLVFGTVGRLQAVKDHRGLITAFSELRSLLPLLSDRMRLVIVGDGPCKQALQDQIHALGLDELVVLTGARSDVALLMRHFSLFVMSSIAEGTPVTILEAMSSGLAVVATQVGGIPEVVQTNWSGLLVPANDPSSLAQAMAVYCRNPALAKQHGANGRAHVETNFSIRTTVAQYLSLYDDMRHR